jgi:hypothetical protein
MNKDKLPKELFSAPLILVILLAFSLACISIASPKNRTIGGCSPLPARFSEMDLIGTWVARSLVHQSSDTLYIRDDGTYKQIIQLEYPSIEYESDWQPWSFEYRDNGTGYLHLDDYRTCAADVGDFEPSCDLVYDGKIPWADVCEGQWMEPGPNAGEIILVAEGIPGNSAENRSHPFILTLFKGFESNPWTYSFVEP